jgi:hypothetical protein
LTGDFAVRRFVADFFGAAAEALAVFCFADLRFGGPAAARAASRSSASLNVSASTAVPLGSEAFVSPSVT